MTKEKHNLPKYYQYNIPIATCTWKSIQKGQQIIIDSAI